MLFMNGIPVVVVECKSPSISSDPPAEAIDQLRRHHYARKDAAEVDEVEGAERLFHTNQFLVATATSMGVGGTFGAEAEHSPSGRRRRPFSRERVQADLDKPTLSSQIKLIAGMSGPRTCSTSSGTSPSTCRFQAADVKS